MHHFPWLRNRTTEHRKAGKARNTKENRRSKEFSTASKLLVVHRSSASDSFCSLLAVGLLVSAKAIVQNNIFCGKLLSEELPFSFEERRIPMGNISKKALKAAFPYTIPIFAGFQFLGLTYGVYMNVSGFSFWYPTLMSLTIFAGSMEFVTVHLLLGAFHPLQALVMTLMINARHLFYGISMLDRFKSTG